MSLRCRNVAAEGERRRSNTPINRVPYPICVTHSSSKQDAAAYKSSIPAFRTIGDDVKCFEGIDYGKVYKTPKDLDSTVLERYAKGEFVPSRRVFWKVLLVAVSYEIEVSGGTEKGEAEFIHGLCREPHRPAQASPVSLSTNGCEW